MIKTHPIFPAFFVNFSQKEIAFRGALLIIKGTTSEEGRPAMRTEQKLIGQAHVVCARTRAKYVGGSRAAYDESQAF